MSFPRPFSRTKKRKEPGPLEEAVALRAVDTRWERLNNSVAAGALMPNRKTVRVGFVGGETSVVLTATELDKMIDMLLSVRALMEE